MKDVKFQTPPYFGVDAVVGLTLLAQGRPVPSSDKLMPEAEKLLDYILGVKDALGTDADVPLQYKASIAFQVLAGEERNGHVRDIEAALGAVKGKLEADGTCSDDYLAELKTAVSKQRDIFENMLAYSEPLAKGEYQKSLKQIRDSMEKYRAFGAKAVAGVIMLSREESPPEDMRLAAQQLIDYVLPECPEKKIVDVSANAWVTYEALASPQNKDALDKMGAIHKAITERFRTNFGKHGSSRVFSKVDAEIVGDNEYFEAHMQDRIEALLENRKDIEVIASKISIEEYYDLLKGWAILPLKKEQKSYDPLALLHKKLLFAGIDMKKVRIDPPEVAADSGLPETVCVTVATKDAKRMHELIKDQNLGFDPFRKEDSHSGEITFRISLAPLTYPHEHAEKIALAMLNSHLKPMGRA